MTEEAASEDEARRARHADLMRRLRESIRLDEERNPLGIDLPRTFLLAATPDEFHTWLGKATRNVRLRKFVTAAGHYTLQAPRLEELEETDDVFRIITMDGLYHEAQGGTTYLKRLIFCSLNPLADGRQAVQVTCTQQALAEYYHALLKKIARYGG